MSDVWDVFRVAFMISRANESTSLDHAAAMCHLPMDLEMRRSIAHGFLTWLQYEARHWTPKLVLRDGRLEYA